MASQEVHLQRAAHHKKALAFLNAQREFADWSAVVAFYAAVEFAEAILASDGIDSKDHHSRKQALRQRFREGRRLAFYEAYNHLYQYSLDARYFQALPADSELERLLDCLQTIESFTTSILSKKDRS